MTVFNDIDDDRATKHSDSHRGRQRLGKLVLPCIREFVNLQIHTERRKNPHLNLSEAVLTQFHSVHHLLMSV